LSLFDAQQMHRNDPGTTCEHQAAGGQIHLPGRTLHLPVGGGAAGQSGLRNGTPELRDVEQLHEPDAGADQAVE